TPSSPRGRISAMHTVRPCTGPDIIGIGCLTQAVGMRDHRGGCDPSVLHRDFFRAGDFHALATLDRPDEGCSLVQAVMRAGIEPGIAPSELFDMEGPALEIDAVDVGDFEFAAR